MPDMSVDLVLVHNNQSILLIGIVCMLFVSACINTATFRDMEKLIERLSLKIEKLEKSGEGTPEYQLLADV